jgi:hypothetical protein
VLSALCSLLSALSVSALSALCSLQSSLTHSHMSISTLFTPLPHLSPQPSHTPLLTACSHLCLSHLTFACSHLPALTPACSHPCLLSPLPALTSACSHLCLLSSACSPLLALL